MVGRRRPGHRLFARQALPHEAGEDAGRLRRPESAAGVPEHAGRRCLRLAARRPGRRGAQRRCPTGAAGRRGRASSTRSPTATARRPSRCSPGPRAAGGPHRVRPSARPGSNCATSPERSRSSTARSVRPGDRFESLRPGYEVVRPADGLAAVRAAGPLAQVSADRRSLLLTTAPHPEASAYAITLPAPGRPDSARPGRGGLPQVAGDRSRLRPLRRQARRGRPRRATEAGRAGCRTSTWPSPGLSPRQRGSRPALACDRAAGPADARHQARLWQMLRPAVQPGSTTGYTLPDEEVRSMFSAPRPIEVTTPPARLAS